MHPRVVLAGLIVRQSFRLGDPGKQLLPSSLPCGAAQASSRSNTFSLWSLNTAPQASLTGEDSAARDVALAAYSM